jgi:DDE superfamily endonuclease
MYYSSDDDDDDDDLLFSPQAALWFDDEEDDIQAAVISQHLQSTVVRKKTRKRKWRHTRIAWNLHVQQLHHEGLFARTYRMSHPSFIKLQELLGDGIRLRSEHNPGMAPIPVEIVMACGIRWLAGGTCLDIKTSMGISLTSVYRFRDIFLAAVNLTPALELVFPQNDNDIEKATRAFCARSKSGIMAGCVGCVDGYLATVVRPRMDECDGNPGAFYSGHYGVYGLNVQAVCNHKSQFIYFAVVAPGKCGDQVAYERTSLPTLMQALPLGTYLIGDAAYSVGEKMLVPFTGSQRSNPSNDAYNFYLSQLRIRIEMAFGLMTNKWRILRAPLQTSLAKSSEVLECCSRLHNFCIAQKNRDNDEVEDCDAIVRGIPPMPGAEFGWGYLPTIEALVHQHNPIPGTSQIRDIIVRRVNRLGLRRPAANIERARYELHQINLM